MLKFVELEKREKALLTLIQSNPVPAYRQAYSDRTAWLMACLSELVYQDFGTLDPNSANAFLQKRLDIFLEERTKEALSKLVFAIHERDEDKTNSLISEIDDYGFDVVSTYDHKDTQAILVSTDTFIALAFRGTEADSLRDIKYDINAKKKRSSIGGAIHSGFNEAFDAVKAKIQADLNKEEFSNKPLFITGHSLGGALATIAAKQLKHKGGIAACYTFGAPRVGDEEWAYGIKTPIYRVVNAIDCVTMLPPSGFVVSVITLILVPLSSFGRAIRQFILKGFGGYHHVGDMRYLTNCKPGDYKDVRLLTAVSWPRRIQTILRGKSVSGFVKDHSISIYRKKLAIIALRHNED